MCCICTQAGKLRSQATNATYGGMMGIKRSERVREFCMDPLPLYTKLKTLLPCCCLSLGEMGMKSYTLLLCNCIAYAGTCQWLVN